MQHANQKVPPTEGRPLSRKRSDASKTLDEQTKKQRETPRAQWVGYSEHKRQPLSEMSHTHRDFFGFVPPSLLGRIQCTTGGQKCNPLDVCLKWGIFSDHCGQYGYYQAKCPMKMLTPSELGFWLFKRQVEDGTHSQAMSRCSLKGFPYKFGNQKEFTTFRIYSKVKTTKYPVHGTILFVCSSLNDVKLIRVL